MKKLFTIEGVDVFEESDGRVHWTGKMAIDCDGSGGNPDGDPDFQPDTTLHHNGRAINAQTVPFIVVPPGVRKGVRGVVMGCQAKVTNLSNGRSAMAVVADVGPMHKIGEGSPALAVLLGLDGNARHGGTDEHIIQMEIFPGIPASVAGETYSLMPA